jgi:hypothetical protein
MLREAARLTQGCALAPVSALTPPETVGELVGCKEVGGAETGYLVRTGPARADSEDR